MRSVLSAFIIFFAIVSSAMAESLSSELSQWHQIKGDHFVVYVVTNAQDSAGRDVLRAAEDYYDKIARQIGYARYSNFWTWEERVKIIIFPDQESFTIITGQPAWSKGYAVRDSRMFESRAIVTFLQEDGFLSNVLPHEIGHLIFKDFIGFNRPVPLWFEEGIAQLQEAPDEAAQRGMAYVVKNGEAVPFELLGRLDIRQEKDPRKVSVFYAQSRMVLEFLIKNYGQEAFERLCRELKEGRTFEEALRIAYSTSIDSIKTLESKWIGYMSEK